jgi:multidrug efflux pump subunit AcrA (membrane-fusion protein)
MSIDAIGSVVSGVNALAPSRTELTAGNRGGTTGQSSGAPVQVSNDQPKAAIVAISAEALAQQQAAEQQAQAAQQQTAQEQAAQGAAASASAVTGAISSDWAAGTPTVDNAAVQEALDALDEASRENNLQLEQDAIQAQQDQTAREQQAIDDAATVAANQQDDLTLAAVNASIQLAYGALATPITGDPALRQPGKVEIVA